MEIFLSGYKVDCSIALNDIDALADHLIRAKAERGCGLCLCTTFPRKLVIRTARNRHFLAVWSHDGHNHHFACPFYRDAEDQQSAGGASEPAVKEQQNGFQIAVEFPLGKLTLNTGPTEPDSAGTHGQAPVASRSRMGLLGILHYLWTVSRLNQWNANWKRDWWRVTHALVPVLEQGTLANQPMTQCIYLVPEMTRSRQAAIDQAWQGFAERLKPGKDGTHFGLILGEALAIQKSKYGYQLSLKHFAALLYMTDALREKIAISHSKAYHRIGSKSGELVISMCLVEMSRKGNLTVIDAALMATSAQFIPFDSSHKALLAHQLVAQKRSFIKPLTIKAGESTLPDFILTDTEPPFVLEVWGMSTPAYAERKQKKLETYRNEGRPVWSWDAQRLPNMPPLLPAPLSPVHFCAAGFNR